jgi:hypothetical protein
LRNRGAALIAPDADSDDLAEQVSLGGERQVDGLLGDARLGRDLGHRGWQITVPQEQPLGGKTNPATRGKGALRCSQFDLTDKEGRCSHV